MFIPEKHQLRGLSYSVAERYGKPHIRAHYKARNVKSNSLDQYARCIVCGEQATNSHHEPPIRHGKSFLLVANDMIFELKPALIALCGSGTTGCHNDFHGGARYRIEWIWNDDSYAAAWWSGEILSKIEPHSPELFMYGHWLITDKKTGEKIIYRGDAS